MNEDDDGKIWTLFWFDTKTSRFESEVMLTRNGAIDRYHKMRGYEREMNIQGLKIFEGINISDNVWKNS